MLLEVIACSVEDAVAAERGGAGRLEIARAMDRAGLTPPESLVREIAAAVRIPLRVMVRENDGFTCRGEDELAALRRAAAALASIPGVEGLVVGFIRADEVDHDALGAVLAAAPRLRATFHRAFDALQDPRAALAALKRHAQVDRVLSGGGEGGWTDRCRRLSDLAAHAAPEIGILPGGGIDAAAVAEIARTPLLTEAHVGRAVRVPHETWGRVSEPLVRILVKKGDSHT
jgi:copper homeostasis protein